MGARLQQQEAIADLLRSMYKNIQLASFQPQELYPFNQHLKTIGVPEVRLLIYQ
ncbi:MAG: hypothetical protein AAF939_02680 [Planctomycetota bacterium]